MFDNVDETARFLNNAVVNSLGIMSDNIEIALGWFESIVVELESPGNPR